MLAAINSCPMDPSLVNTIVDGFFEVKKSEIRQRLRMEMDRVVDDLFGQLVGEVKQLLMPKNQTVASSSSLVQNNQNDQFGLVPSKYVAVKSIVPNNNNRPETNNQKTIQVELSYADDNGDSDSKFDINGRKIMKRPKSANSDSGDIDVKNSDHKKQHKFICTVSGCGKQFDRNFVLKRHQRIHENIKPFRCRWPDCSYASSERSHTIRHIQRIHLSVKAKKGNIDAMNMMGNEGDDENMEGEVRRNGKSASGQIEQDPKQYLEVVENDKIEITLKDD